MEEEASAMSGLRWLNNGCQIVFSGYDFMYAPDERRPPIIKWYAINIKIPDPEKAETHPSSEELSTNKLIPFFAVKLYKNNFFSAIGSHIYCVDNVGSVQHIRTLNVKSPSDGWKFGPPMTTARDMSFSQTMVLDGKLYVLGGLPRFPPQPLQHQYHWMEVFDPSSNTWEALPNPPSEIHPRQMITAVIESRKQILVTSLLELPNNERSAYSEAIFYTYNVTTRCWATLESPVRKLRGGSIHKFFNVAVGNTLYWAFLEKYYLVVQAYDLDKDVWFEGSENIREEFFGKHEYPSYSSKLGRVPFLHLYDQKFCLLMRSDFSKRNRKWKLLERETHYLNCFIFEVTPVFKNQDEYGFWELNISVVSVKKSPMDQNFIILEGQLM